MPAWLGGSCTAVVNSARCSTSNAGGNHQSAQKPAPSHRPPQTPWSIGQWCGHPVPRLGLPPPPSNPAPAATSRANVPVPGASALDTSAVVPQPHPSATAPVVAPSPSCPTATPTPIRSANTASIANSTQPQCGFHLGSGLVLQLQICGAEFQAASIMTTPGRCLVAPSPPRPGQDEIRQLVLRPYQACQQPSHLRDSHGDQFLIGAVTAPFSPPSTA